MSDPDTGAASGALSVTMCGVRVDLPDMRTALSRVVTAAAEREPLSVHFANAYTMSLAMSDESYADLLARSDLTLPDGRPIVWATRWSGIVTAEQVCGPDFMLYAFEQGSELRHYIYGSTERTVSWLGVALRRRFPEAEIAGSESPPFRPLTREEERMLVERIHESDANVVWVGLGTPKQDLFVERMKQRIRLPLVAVGAAFDFHAGTKKRAPRWMSRVGLEWLHRLAIEPRRLAFRYVVGNSRFLAGIVRGGIHAE